MRTRHLHPPVLKLKAESDGHHVMDTNHGICIPDPQIQKFLVQVAPVLYGYLSVLHPPIIIGNAFLFMLEDMMAGKAVSRENYYECKMHYGTSCGCENYDESAYGERL